MDPTVTSAWIAAGVSVVTLTVTMAVQYRGYRGASRDAEKAAAEQREHLDRTLAEQRDQLDRTLAEQRDQLDRTLAEQRDQLDRTLAEQRTRTLNERFATAAEQLGNYNKPAVRLAGVYAMAGLADDWEENRQTCVDVLCAYLRMPYEVDPGLGSPGPQRLAFQADREVRHTLIRVIAAHLSEGASVPWQGLDLDFTGVVFDGGDFRGAEFTGGVISFRNTVFSSGDVYFSGVHFSGGEVDFSYAEFSGGKVYFPQAQFCGAEVYFGTIRLTGGLINLVGAGFSDGVVDFGEAEFSGGEVDLIGAGFSGGEVQFGLAQFTGSRITFAIAKFRAGLVDFRSAKFSGGTLDFAKAEFSGSDVHFAGAQFSGGTLDFGQVDDWSTPPGFPWTETPPPGVTLPDSGAALSVRYEIGELRLQQYSREVPQPGRKPAGFGGRRWTDIKC
jgi:uncharacterized protein YjbI with pentapeptide repeats